jgi:oxygen-independent coproporphyrinogen-3 oxidase
MQPFSLYLHIPFCQHRCGYCDFNTYSGLETLIPDYVPALCREIEWAAELAGKHLPAQTIFFGGGTPSLLPEAGVEQVLKALDCSFILAQGIEITLEANPGTLSRDYLKSLHQLGFNRLSLGMQSANPAELRLLERQHDYPDVIQAVKWARQAGFDNLNLDLIFGLPEQSLESWQRSLDLALGLGVEHFALYALTLEHGTPFGHWAARGLLSRPDPDLAAEMYEWASERLEDEGYAQYEISNWARRRSEEPPLSPTANPGYACRHNLQYWRNLPYLGFGAGAHGFAGGRRTANVLAPAAYIQRLKGKPARSGDFPITPAIQSHQEIDRSSEIAETMMMGLRLTREGVSARAFEERFAERLSQRFAPQIRRLGRLGLLEWAGNGDEALRLTKAGRLLGNQVFVEFV